MPWSISSPVLPLAAYTLAQPKVKGLTYDSAEAKKLSWSSILRVLNLVVLFLGAPEPSQNYSLLAAKTQFPKGAAQNKQGTKELA